MKAATFQAVAPVLLVRDVRVAAAHYQDKLGFHQEVVMGEPVSFVIVGRDGLRLMLKQADDPKHVIPHWTVSPKLCNAYFWVDDIDALYRELVQRGARIDYGPCDQPYGCREFGVQDTDGHDLAFGQRM